MKKCEQRLLFIARARAARVRACNSTNLNTGGIIEPLLIVVNILRMRPGFGVAHSDQPARHGYGRVRSVGVLYRIWRSQQKGFVHFEDVKRFCLQVVSNLESGSARGSALTHDQVFYF